MLSSRALPSEERMTFVIMVLTAILAAVAIFGIISYIWNHLAMVPRIRSEFASLDRISSTISAYNHLRDKGQLPKRLRDKLLVLDEECWR